MINARGWVFLVPIALAAHAPAQIWNPPVHVVNVSCCAFSDSTSGTSVTIVPGNTIVRWALNDAASYTVTSGTGPADPAAGVLFNGSLGGSNAVYERLFNVVGTYPYFCSLHPGMTGLIHVLPQAAVIYVFGGCLSSTGASLSLWNSGPPAVGNAAFALGFSGAVPGGQCWIFMAATFAASPLTVAPGCEALLDLGSLGTYLQAGVTPTGPATANVSGTASFPFPIPLIPSLGGMTVAAQGLVFDPGAPAGTVLSNALFIVVGA
jgi:hypothetical protein